MAIFNVGATGGGGSNGGLPSYYIYDEYMTEVPSGFFSPYPYYSQIITNSSNWAYVTCATYPDNSINNYDYANAYISSIYAERIDDYNRVLRIELPNVTSVNEFAFTNCLYLSEVILPNYTVDNPIFFIYDFQMDINLQYLSVKHIDWPIDIRIYASSTSKGLNLIKQPMIINAQTINWSNHIKSVYNGQYSGIKPVILQTPEVHLSLIPPASSYTWNYATVIGYSGYCSQLVPITTSSDYYWPHWVEYLNLSGLSQIPQSAFGNGYCGIETLILPDVVSMHSQFRTSAWNVGTLVCPKLTSIPTCLVSMLNSSTTDGFIELGVSKITSNQFCAGYRYSFQTGSPPSSRYATHYGIYSLSLPNLTNISAYTFSIPKNSSLYSNGYRYWSYWLDFTLDLRGVSSVPTAAANWLSYSSLYDFKIYVPRSLYSDFYNAPNWSTTAIRNALISV